MNADASRARDFYDREYRGTEYACYQDPQQHSEYSRLTGFIERYRLGSKRCLEVGCGRGAFQDSVSDYTGVDYSESVAPFLRKPFIQATATSLPFDDNSFDALWSITVLEHIAEPELALAEFRRVLKPGGLLYLAPAWQCRSWAADGYPVRPYSDFGLGGKLLKASIPIRDSVWFRACLVFPRRLMRAISQLVSPQATRFRFRRLQANYEKYWMADSDACCSMDPFEAIVWFRSRGDICLEPSTRLRQFFFRTGPLVFRVNK